MNTSALNPFIYGKPVPSGRFIGRQAQVRTLFSRIVNGESTAIVGEPHIGKSSLLAYTAAPDTRQAWLDANVEQHIVAEFDCHLLSSDFTANEFWRHVLDEVEATSTDDALKQQCALIEQNNFGSLTLERLFKLLGRQQKRLVLLIDEFDAMLNHPQFSSAEFMGALRSFATRTDGLVVITASRLTISQMNRLSTRHNPHGSPFFNNMTEVRLPHLSEAEAAQLIENTLQLQQHGNAIAFDEVDRRFISDCAGRHPFLIQVAAASLHDAKAAVSQAKASAVHAHAFHASATVLFQERTAAHFEDVARTLEANAIDPIKDEDRIDQVGLRLKLCEAFSREELQVLCFDLGVDYEDLSEGGKPAVAVQLILSCQRRSLLQKLREVCQRQRPAMNW
jgi:hypothetical protein